MSRIASLFRMIAIIGRYGTTRAGDIAVHKADVFLGRVRPDLAEALERIDPVVPRLDMDALRRLPEGSFGRRYAEFLDANGLHPFVVTGLTPEAVLARNVHWARYALVHDMFHVLLGAGPDLVGEMKVYAFTLRQRLGLMFWVFLPLAWLVIPLLAPHRLGALVAEFRAGYRLGRRCPELMKVRLEDRLGDPLDEVREAVGLPRAQKGESSRTTKSASSTTAAQKNGWIAKAAAPSKNSLTPGPARSPATMETAAQARVAPPSQGIEAWRASGRTMASNSTSPANNAAKSPNTMPTAWIHEVMGRG